MTAPSRPPYAGSDPTGPAALAPDHHAAARVAADHPDATGAGPSGTGAATRLTLLCAGATAATRTAAFPSGDEPLDERRLRRLPALAARLGRPGRCCCSPAASAVGTAAALGLPHTVEPLLRECDYGCWTGLMAAELAQADAPGLAAWLADPEARPHGGETMAEVAARVATWLASVAGSGRVLAVVPPLLVRIAATLALDVRLDTVGRLDAAPLSLTRLTAVGGRWRLAGFNERP